MEASAFSGAVAAGDGDAGGAAGEVAATAGDDVAAGVLAGVGVGFTGEFCATIVGLRAAVGDGVGVAFWFFLLPLVGFVGDGGGAGGGVTTATLGASNWAAGSTRINSFAAGGGGVGARPATGAVAAAGALRSR